MGDTVLEGALSDLGLNKTQLDAAFETKADQLGFRDEINKAIASGDTQERDRIAGEVMDRLIDDLGKHSSIDNGEKMALVNFCIKCFDGLAGTEMNKDSTLQIFNASIKCHNPPGTKRSTAFCLRSQISWSGILLQSRRCCMRLVSIAPRSWSTARRSKQRTLNRRARFCRQLALAITQTRALSISF